MPKSAAHALATALCSLGLLLADDVSQTPQGTVTSRQAPGSRAEQIEAARERKSERQDPPDDSGLERALIFVKDRRLLDKWKYGWHGIKPRIGAMITGSGFAVGPEFRRDDLLGGQVNIRVTTNFSLKQYQLYDAELLFPRLADDHAFVSLEARHRNYTQMPYYGPGPDSLKTGRSNYRLEDTLYGFRAGIQPAGRRWFSAGVTGGLLQVNTGPGTSDDYISTDAQYSPAQTPGIRRQSDFFQGGVFARLDTRDIPGGPRSGTLLHSDFLYNKDTDAELYSHRRLNLEAQQYVPFFNKRRVIALRARSELTWKNAGQSVPFFLQSTLGGSDDLRGFRPFRFYDDNKMVFNAEYRYEVFAGLDMAVFADTGKVFHSKSNWNLDDLEGAYGIGMRFNARNVVFMRIDAGFSHEGFQVWVKFNNVF